MTEPCAVALHGVRRMTVEPGMNAAVIGAGPIGNMVAQWLRIGGCKQVVLVDIDKRKLGIGKEMGFDIIDSSRGDPVASLNEKSEGYGFDCVVEACGLPATFLQALQVAARFAQVVFMGNINGEFDIGEKDFSSILRRELTILGTWNSKVVPRGRDDWSVVLSYMDRELIVEPLISHTPPLEEGPQMFRKVMDRNTYTDKVIFRIED
jgi:threonine dehydrogenase-like Zn-dependent dehydrogenase